MGKAIAAGRIIWMILHRITSKFRGEKEMRKHILVVMTAILVLALATLALAADDPHVGTWKLNLAKSKHKSGPPPKNETATFTARDNGIKLVLDGVDVDGKAFHSEFAGKFDGKDYPFTGSSDSDTVAIKKIDANAWAEVLKKAGKEVSTGRNSISKDGKILMHTTKGKDAKGHNYTDIDVYDRQ